MDLLWLVVELVVILDGMRRADILTPELVVRGAEVLVSLLGWADRMVQTPVTVIVVLRTSVNLEMIGRAVNMDTRQVSVTGVLRAELHLHGTVQEEVVSDNQHRVQMVAIHLHLTEALEMLLLTLVLLEQELQRKFLERSFDTRIALRASRKSRSMSRPRIVGFTGERDGGTASTPIRENEEDWYNFSADRCEGCPSTVVSDLS